MLNDYSRVVFSKDWMVGLYMSTHRLSNHDQGTKTVQRKMHFVGHNESVIPALSAKCETCGSDLMALNRGNNPRSTCPKINFQPFLYFVSQTFRGNSFFFWGGGAFVTL